MNFDQDLFNDFGPIIGSIFNGVRKTINNTLPDAEEICIAEKKEVVYSFGPVGSILKVVPMKQCVRIELPAGSRLHDPQMLLEGAVNHFPYVKVQTMVVATSPALRELVKQAWDEALTHQANKK